MVQVSFELKMTDTTRVTGRRGAVYVKGREALVHRGNTETPRLA